MLPRVVGRIASPPIESTTISLAQSGADQRRCPTTPAPQHHRHTTASASASAPPKHQQSSGAGASAGVDQAGAGFPVSSLAPHPPRPQTLNQIMQFSALVLSLIALCGSASAFLPVAAPRASLTRVSMGYVPDGLTPAQYKALQAKETVGLSLRDRKEG